MLTGNRQFTNSPPVHQARLTKHYKTQVGQEKFFWEKNVLCHVTLLARHMTLLARHVTLLACHAKLLARHVTLLARHMTLLARHMTLLARHVAS